MLKKCIATAVAGLAISCAAHAQGSVTLYGNIDNGVLYQSSQTTVGSVSGGHSAVKMSSGTWLGSQIGFKGTEPIAPGTNVVFNLQQGFTGGSGAEQVSGLAFAREAWVGIDDQSLGRLTAGRQYTAYMWMLLPYSPMKWLSALGAHPGDNDSLDFVYRANNSLTYKTRNYNGFVASGSYSFGGVPGSLNAGSAWSAGFQYVLPRFGFAAAFQRIENGTPGGGAWSANSAVYSNGQPGTSAINDGYLTSQAQQRVAVSGGWQITSTVDVAATFANVKYIPGINSVFHQMAVFNNIGATIHWAVAPSFDVAAGYVYTYASKANGIHNAATYNQFNMAQAYAVSTRTTLYAVEAYQRATGDTLGSAGAGNVVTATASIGDELNSAPSSSPSQVVVTVGVRHLF